MNPTRFLLPAILGAALLCACQPAPVILTAPLPTHTPTLSNTSTAAPQPTLAPTVPSTPAPQVCSPLEGYTADQLKSAVVNPYHPPLPGSDDPHQGVDLAVEQGSMAVSGHTIQAALPGTVVVVLANRFPYGNAVMIATPLENLPADFAASLPQVSQPTAPPNSPLTCPPFTVPADWDARRPMLYVLYAHMENAPTLKIGDTITCGQTLGTVGSSGNALNPHLHFEIRVGPAQAQFASMAHYDVSASPEEMANYCVWRISGWFQHLDPLPLLQQIPQAS